MQNLLPDTLTLKIRLGQHIPSKKNHHYQGANGRLLIDKEVKERMKNLENAILLSLYSLCQTTESGMDSECRKQLRTLLSGLSDDSIREVPKFSFDVEYVEKGFEGVRIEIEKI